MWFVEIAILSFTNLKSSLNSYKINFIEFYPVPMLKCRVTCSLIWLFAGNDYFFAANQ